MSNRDKYKQVRNGFGNVAQNRLLRTENLREQRRDQRARLFSNIRNVPEEKTEAQKVPTLTQRRLNKKQKELEKKPSNLDKRPPFVVGIVHYPLCPIPPLNIDPLKHLPKSTKTNLPRSEKKISKATEKRLAAKASGNLTTQTLSTKKYPKTVRITKKSSPQKSENAPFDVTFKKESPVSKMEVSITKRKTRSSDKKQKTGEGKMVNQLQSSKDHHSFNRTSTPNCSAESIRLQMSSESTKVVSDVEATDGATGTVTPESGDAEPVFLFSPYIVHSRGKRNARKELEMRLGFSRSPSDEEDIPMKETVMNMLNISVEEEERTAQYFKFMANKEIMWLDEVCTKWEDITIKGDVPLHADKIFQGIEMAQLLRKKVTRFLGQANDCERSRGKELVNCKDLQGFWSRLLVELEDCDSHFKHLEQWQSHNWELPETKSLSNDFEIDLNPAISSLDKPPQNPMFKFFRTSKLSERTSTPKAPIESLKLKAPNVELDTSISYINSEQTPGRSILKKIEENSREDKLQRSTQKVSFDDTVVENEIPLDEENENEQNLAEALARIDSLFSDNEPEYEIRAERKLNFDESDVNKLSRFALLEAMKDDDANQRQQFVDEKKNGDNDGDEDKNEGDNNNRHHHHNQDLKEKNQDEDEHDDGNDEEDNYHFHQDLNEKKSKDYNGKNEEDNYLYQDLIGENKNNLKEEDDNLSKNDLKNEDLISEDEGENKVVTRLLRNRTVSTPVNNISNNKNKPWKKNNAKLSQTVNCTDANSLATPQSIKRRRTTAFVENSKNFVEESPLTRKRSTRKSIRFNEDTCTACTPQKHQTKSVMPRRVNSSKKIHFDE